MAIKGKKKPKSGGRRPASPAPKREVVVPKTPLWSRTDVRIGVATVVALLLGLGLGYGFGNQASEDAASANEAQLKKAFTAYQEQIDPILATVGTATGGGFDVLPDVKTAITSLQSGDDHAKAMKDLQQASKDAKTAIAGLSQIDGAALGGGLPQEDVDDIVGSKQAMADGLELLQQAAHLAEAGDPASIQAANQLGELGGSIFQQGYQRFIASTINAKVTLSTQNLQGPDLSSGVPGSLVPGPGGVPGGAPGGVPPQIPVGPDGQPIIPGQPPASGQ